LLKARLLLSSHAMKPIEHFSQRLLNPFRGVLNIISYDSAEAVTTDGVRWDIYVRNDELVKDLENSYKVQTSDIRYGSWSRESSLKRGPVFPSEDFKRLEEMGAVVYEHLLQTHQQVPFPMKDQYELWLLDESQLPLVLLDSTVFSHDMDLQQAIDWRAGLACRENFSAPVVQELDPEAKSAAEYLANYINNLAGDKPTAQWFHRQANDAGLGLQGINMAGDLEGRHLGAEFFPEFFVQIDGHDDKHSKLIQEFLAWQAPWLLLLSGLDNDVRQMLEQQARQQALVVDKQFRLYPEIIDPAFIKAARVEAMLRKGQQQKSDQEDIMSTFYIELHPSPTE
jgi:hypothetical protein